MIFNFLFDQQTRRGRPGQDASRAVPEAAAAAAAVTSGPTRRVSDWATGMAPAWRHARRVRPSPAAIGCHENMASRARKKMNKSSCSSRCGLAALQRGHRHRLHRRYCCLFFGRSGLYPQWRPCPGPRAAAALGCGGPGGTPQATRRARSEIFKLSLHGGPGSESDAAAGALSRRRPGPLAGPGRRA